MPANDIALQLFDLMARSRQWTILEVDGLMTQGIERFQQRADKNWSLVDWIGMIVAEKHGITEIFTTDHHFEQAGFKVLLQKKIVLGTR